jgi:hypothetical protein
LKQLFLIFEQSRGKKPNKGRKWNPNDFKRLKGIEENDVQFCMDQHGTTREEMNALAMKLYKTSVGPPRVSEQNTNLPRVTSERRPLTYSEAKQARTIDAKNKALKELLAKQKVRDLNEYLT